MRLGLVWALAASLLIPSAAEAGGWATSAELSRSRVAPGQRVELKASVMVRSAEAADGFRVYVLRDFDDSIVVRAMSRPRTEPWWSLGGAAAIEVGRVAVNVGTATAAFTVPDLPPGTYHLMLCDAGCTKPLADIVPAAFTIVADPTTALLADRVDRLEHRNRKRAAALAAARAETRRALREVAHLESRVTFVAARDSEPASPWTHAGWLVAAGALAPLLVLTPIAVRRTSAARRSGG